MNKKRVRLDHRLIFLIRKVWLVLGVEVANLSTFVLRQHFGGQGASYAKVSASDVDSVRRSLVIWVRGWIVLGEARRRSEAELWRSMPAVAPRRSYGDRCPPSLRGGAVAANVDSVRRSPPHRRLRFQITGSSKSEARLRAETALRRTRSIIRQGFGIRCGQRPP